MSGAKLLWSAVLSALLALSCRAGEATRVGAAASASTGVPSPIASASSQVGPAASKPTPMPTPAALPKLKPIQPKPFPEGVDEATVCEAIDSKEPDLWVRFGHLVPAYVIGAIYVLETGPQTKDKLYDYIGRNYVYGYYSQQASCRGNLTLLYIRLMFDKSEYNGKPFGREHLSQAIEKRFGIRTRESFQLNYEPARLGGYCREDGELCDRLFKVDRGNEGTGLCGRAIGECPATGPQRTEAELMNACRQHPVSAFACLGYAPTGRERIACREKVIAALCP